MTPTLMWEARAADGRRDELLAHVREQAVVALAGAERHELFVADGGRVVVIAVGVPAGTTLPEPPGELLARPPHSWGFDRVGP
ncbi:MULTISPECIES: hypothetical protein [Pseudonocardia]|uniref:hypothetical protein n=1 Tax=Pseudonocardia TaxID=1847 RepID=UPI0013716165|nr:hypothetical protein [Pseudonocardia sp. SID8383]MYW74989.1 hypothetical protein [Pseudonocardia sp. SID8383]